MFNRDNLLILRRSQVSLWGLGLLWALLVGLGTRYFISDSEFWPMSVAQEFGQQPVRHVVLLYKPLFHALLKIPYLFPLDSREHILVSKFIFAALGVTSLFLIIRLTLDHAGRRAAWFMGITLAVSQIYATQFFRIRSDVLSLFFSLIAVPLATSALARSQNRKREHLALAAVASLVVAATPKAIFDLAILTAFALGYGRTMGGPWRHALLRPALWFIVGPLAFLGLAVSVLGNLGFDLAGALAQAAFYFFNSFSEPTTGFGAIDGPFIWRGLVNDLPLWILAIWGWIKLLRTEDKTPFMGAIAAAAPVAFLAMFLHNQRLPFFWGNLWPWLVWPAAVSFSRTNFSRRKWIALGGIVALNLILHFEARLWWTSNRVQLELIENVESFLGMLPEHTVFDGLGILPRSHQALGFYSPGDSEGNRATTELLATQLPAMVIYLDRSFLGEPGLSRILDEKYNSVGGGVWVRKNLNFEASFAGDSYLGKWFSFEPPISPRNYRH